MRSDLELLSHELFIFHLDSSDVLQPNDGLDRVVVKAGSTTLDQI
jgi:hypothetical protein